MDGRINEGFGEFVEAVCRGVKNAPASWRYGQAVFNVIDREYGVARKVQMEDGVDCFFDDKKVDDFIAACWKRVKNEKKIC